MNNFIFKKYNCKEETASTWLIAAMQFGLKINFFKPFESFQLKSKILCVSKAYYNYDVYNNWLRNNERH